MAYNNPTSQYFDDEETNEMFGTPDIQNSAQQMPPPRVPIEEGPSPSSSRPKKSKVWSHFEKIASPTPEEPDRFLIKCKICVEQKEKLTGSRLRYGDGTGKMIRHLKIVHGIVYNKEDGDVETESARKLSIDIKKAKAKKDDAEKIILDQLERLGANEDAIVLTGNPGTGKTWLAKHVTKSAIRTKRSFYMSLWIYLSLLQKQDDGLSLLQSIACQLSIFNVGSVWEDYIIDEKTEKFPDDVHELKRKVSKKLKEKMEKYEGEKLEESTFLLVVLDSEGDVNIDDYRRIKDELFSGEDLKSKIKFLIMSRKPGMFKSARAVEIEVEPFSGHEAVSFLKERVGNEVYESSKFKPLWKAIERRNKVLPAQIVMLAEALKHISKDGSEEQDRAIGAALYALKVARKDDAIPLLRFVYERLPGDLIDFFWHSWNLLGKHGGVQYNELITHWMLEGHLDLADGIKKAYEKGYNVMMELVDRGMLKMQENNLIVLEGATLTLEDPNCREFFETSNLGMAGLIKGEDGKVFERMAPTDGMMKTVSVDKEGKSVCSLLIDGSRLSREEPEAFFQPKQHLKVLALINPRMTKLPEPISKMKNLLLLVLRGCYLLDTVDSIKDLEALVILEISGSPELKKMENDLFEKMTKLRSLNLSALGIESLPNVSGLTKLRRLVIRKCRFVKELPRLANLKKLEVVDFSGSCSLKKLQEKSFKSFENLRVVDFSGTNIEKLPIVQTLQNLTLLLVRGCDNLAGLRFMKYLPKLKVLDLAGATRIKEIYYDCFDNTNNLIILDLSETNIRFLPDSLGKHLRDLKLKGCSKLEKLLSPTGLTDLQSLDLSYSSALKKFPDNFFEKLTSLKSLNLSNSKVECFPSLSSLGNLGRLLLKGCSFKTLPESSFKGLTNLVELDLSDCTSQTEQLPTLEGLKFLEFINLSGYKALSKIDKSFEHMSCLKVLDLSETHISSLPTLCNPSKQLCSLILNNCTKLQNAPDFGTLPQLEELDLRGTSSLKNINAESLSHLTRLHTLRLSKSAFEGIQSYLANLKQLEVLDLSGEAVESLPSLDCLSNLRQLLLRACSSLKEFPLLNSLSKLEVLDLSGTQVTNLGEKISEMTNIKRLHVAEEVVHEFKHGKVLLLEVKLNSEIPEGDKKIVHGKELLTSLKENSGLLDSIRHFSVRAQRKYEDHYGDSRKHIFRDIYSKSRKLPSEAEDGQSLEIQGFNEFPTDIEVLVEQAKYVLLVENDFLKNLSDLKPDGLKNMRGCWLERCNNMKNIFIEADLGKWGTLEILWISNLSELKSLYEDNIQSLSFASIKHLYIDCCPALETVFPSGGIPGNLETLQITFCDKLNTLFGDKGSDSKETPTADSINEAVQTTNPKGEELQAKSSTNKKEPTKKVTARTKSSIDKGEGMQTSSSAEKNKKMEAQAASSADNDKEGKVPPASSADKHKEVDAQGASSADKHKEVDAQGASSADKHKEVDAQGTSSADKHKEVDAQGASSADKHKEVDAQGTSSADKHKEVDAQGASSADKDAHMRDNEMRTTSGTNLKNLHISHCPMLETVFSSGQVPKNLEILRIKRCDKLKNVFTQNCELPYLQKLHLSDLPALTSSSIGILNELRRKVEEKRSQQAGCP